jgi:hypothetical protein
VLLLAALVLAAELMPLELGRPGTVRDRGE